MSDERYRCSFDEVAEEYERARPLYADDAVAWLHERLPLRRVLDLGAGTGKLTRQLVAAGADVVAVEPGDEMRAVFERVLPDVEVLAGSAEAIPLPDGAVDAVAVGQAFHWFRTAEALAEIHRVLRPGGGLALLWNVWDEHDPILHAIGELTSRLRPKESRGNEWREHYDRSLFGPLDERTFRQTRRMTTDALVAWVASTSWIVRASPEDRARVEAEVRGLAGEGPVDVSIGTEVVAADRVGRPQPG